MASTALKNDLKKLKEAVDKSPSICPHLPPRALIFEQDGTLRREPHPCDLCALPRDIRLISFLDSEPEAETRAKMPEWFRPSFDRALADDSVKIYIGLDLDLV